MVDQQVRRKESLAAHPLNQPHRGGGGAAAGDDGGRVFELGSDDEEATRYFAGGVKPRLERFAIASTGLRARVVYSRQFPKSKPEPLEHAAALTGAVATPALTVRRALPMEPGRYRSRQYQCRLVQFSPTKPHRAIEQIAPHHIRNCKPP